jgi:hypothetical protein
VSSQPGSAGSDHGPIEPDEARDLLTRMGAIEVLVEQLDSRVGEVALQVVDERRLRERDKDEIDFRVSGLEHAADALGPLGSVPATVSALEQELVALGERLDIAVSSADARHELISREIDARVSVSESRLALRQAEEWESAQDSLAAAEERAHRAEAGIEERLAIQALTASAALEDLEERITASLESLAGRMGATAGASGALAESTITRLELLEQDITEIESQFAEISGRLAARRSGQPEPPADPIEAATAERAAQAPAPPPPDPPPAAVPPVEAPATPSGPIDLNTATFEMLRSLGCSVTQTARILSARKLRGGFDSPQELEEVPGIPAEFRAELIGKLTV